MEVAQNHIEVSEELNLVQECGELDLLARLLSVLIQSVVL